MAGKRLPWCLGLLLLAAWANPALAELGRITPDNLLRRLGQPGLVVIDVRVKDDWRGSGHKIMGARREDPGQVKKWASHYDRKATVVVYCA